jgi:ubiquinone/menaquinone biosynthesis C-methylase UbiE
MKVDTARKVKSYYERKDVADEYISKRFSYPIHLAEHELQVELLNKLIKENGTRKILEIAPGPARLTREIKANGTALEYSKEMIKLAKENMKGSKYKWRFVKGDAFKLPFKSNSFDTVFTFRFIRHFKTEKRQKLYSEIRRVLKPGGFFVFEALNKPKNEKIRKIVGKEKYVLYDVLYDKRELLKELNDNGFGIVSLNSTVNSFYVQTVVSKLAHKLGLNTAGKALVKALEHARLESPLGWVVICRKK